MKVFISHAGADNAFARELVEELRAAKLKVWFDGTELAPGDNIALEVGRALDESDAMVVLLSPAAMESQWVRSEIDYALAERRFKNRLIPVQVKPSAKIPWVLRELSMVDATKNPHVATKQVVDLLKRARAAA